MKRINESTGKPITIGIPGWKYFDASAFGAGVNHLDFIENFGNAKIIMPWEDLVDVDMLYLPGGLDTAALNYGQTPNYNNSNQDLFKEHFFKTKLPLYIEANIPIFGVCLGAQMLAVQFGATLTQDLKFHEQSSARWGEAHSIWPMNMSAEKPEKKGYKVNSHHHQAVCMNNLTHHIEPLYVATNNDDYFTNDGDIVEAFKIIDKPIYGVQWHPEELYDAVAIYLFNQCLNHIN
jgi:putative glutamine amidotransferase